MPATARDAKGETWFRCGETIRYELTGKLATAVTAKDAFLQIAGVHGLAFGKGDARQLALDLAAHQHRVVGDDRTDAAQRRKPRFPE